MKTIGCNDGNGLTLTLAEYETMTPRRSLASPDSAIDELARLVSSRTYSILSKSQTEINLILVSYKQIIILIRAKQDFFYLSDLCMRRNTQAI